jgi:glycosyltransferase involved in cell wall biosynthesis
VFSIFAWDNEDLRAYLHCRLIFKENKRCGMFYFLKKFKQTALKMEKVLIIDNHLGSLLNFRGDFIKFLGEKKYQVVLCVPFEDKEEKKLKDFGFPYRRIKIHRAKMGLSLINEFYIIYKIIKEEKPDIVFSYTIKPVLFGSLSASFLKVPKIFSLIPGLGYIYTGDSLKKRILRFLVGILYKQALKRNTKVFFLNPDDKKEFIDRKLVPEKIAIQINGEGINLDHFQYHPPPIDPPTFLFVGRLLREKGILEFIKAAEQVKKKHPQVRFLLAGSYDENPASLSKNEFNKLLNKGVIEYLGHVDDIREVIKTSSVFVLPSHREGLPRSTMEAMAIGRAIITTNVPGCRETVKDNGFMVDLNSIPELVNSMEKIINNVDQIEVFGLQSRKIVEEKFESKKILNQLNDIMAN